MAFIEVSEPHMPYGGARSTMSVKDMNGEILYEGNKVVYCMQSKWGDEDGLMLGKTYTIQHIRNTGLIVAGGSARSLFFVQSNCFKKKDDAWDD